MRTAPTNELVVLVAGKDDRAALLGLLRRHASVGIRSIEPVVYTHPDRDPGCRLHAHDFLRPQTTRFARALVVFDREGCGINAPAEHLEREVEGRLAASGWGDRAAVIVIDPELEAWVWSESPHVPRCLGWTGDLAHLRGWLKGQGLWEDGKKPSDPKRAVQRVLHEVDRRRSSSIYSELAKSVGFRKCEDRAFLRLLNVLRGWFPPGSHGRNKTGA